jgi:general secretion pathway protein J
VSRQRGFTLLEVMIALTILSMIMVATIAALRGFGNTKATVTQVTNRLDEVRIVSDFLRNSLGSAMPLRQGGTTTPTFGQAQLSGTYFQGNSAELVWVAPLVAGADLGGAFLMQLAYEEKTLQLRWHRYRPVLEEFNWAEIEPRALLAEVEEFNIGYLPNYGGEWLEEWPESVTNPVAVRLQIKSRNRYWPELVVRLDSGELSPQ